MTPFIPVPNESTHSDVRVHFNNNFSDAESRVSVLESLGLAFQYAQQEPSSAAGSLVFDVSNGYNGKITLTETTSLSFTGASAGDSGVLMIRQDAAGGWGINTTYKIFSGQIGDVNTVTANGGAVISISWYFDGTEYLLWVSPVAS